MQSNTPTKTHLQPKNPMNALRMLIAVGSFAGFVGGWALLAQSGAPAVAALSTATAVGSAPSQAQKVLTTATPVKSPTAVTSTTSPVVTTKPRLRTGGSR